MTLSSERIYRKTELGVAALKTRSGPLTAQGRTALILINGRESLAALAGTIGPDAVMLVEALLALRLVEEVPAAAPIAAARVAAAPVATLSPPRRPCWRRVC